MNVIPNTRWVVFNTPKSTRIKSLHYHKELQKLVVVFQKGGRYLYEPVREELFRELIESESVGKAFQKLIINNEIIQTYKLEEK